MSRSIVRAAVLFLIMTGFAGRLTAQADPDFVVSINPSIVTITQGAMASFTANIVINERATFEFGLSGLPPGVIAQFPIGHNGANTIVLTALPNAATGSFSVDLTSLAGGFTPPRTNNAPQTQTFTLNVKPMPVTQWEYRVERSRGEEDLESTAASLGTQGWELVSVVLSDRDGREEWVGFFKRQKHPHE